MSSFKVIRDKALDVDPDIRFMALEDFKKFLNKGNSSNIEKFVPLLFDLLNDQNPDVKSQTTKLFPIILPFISDEAIINIVIQLYNQVTKPGSDDPVSLMVIKMILSSSFHFPTELSKNVIKLLLPRLISDKITNDIIEVFAEFIKKFSKHFTPDEFWQVAQYLIQLSFSQLSTSINKKAIYALDLLLATEAKYEAITPFLDAISTNFQLSPKNFKCTYNKMDLIYVTVKNSTSWGIELDEPTNKRIFSEIKACFNNVLDDVDYDEILQDNLLKEISLDILLILHNDKEEVKPIIDQFINYSPLKLDDASDFSVDEDEEIEFSEDDEMETADQDFDDGSWKLRLKSIRLINNIQDSSYIPQLIDFIDDKNEFIFKESVNAIMNLTDSQEWIPEIEGRIIKNLDNKNLLVFVNLIESLLQKDFVLSKAFISKFFSFLDNNLKNFELNEVLNIISTIVSKVDEEIVKAIGDQSIPILCNLLNSNVAFASLKILNQFSIRYSNKQIFDTIINKLIDDTKILIDLKTELLNGLTVFILHNKLTEEEASKVLGLYETILNSELLLKPNLINLNKLFAINPNYDYFYNDSFKGLVISKFNPYLRFNKNNKQIYYLILELFTKIDHSVSSNELISLTEMYGTDINMVKLILSNLSKMNITEASIGELILFLNTSDVDDISELDLSDLSRSLCQNANIYDTFESQLNLDKLICVKLLALMALDLKLEQKIISLEEKLNSLLKAKKYDSDWVRLLQFLSFISLSYSLKSIDINALLELLNSGKLDTTAEYEVSKSLGYLTKSNPEFLIDSFYHNDAIKSKLLNSIKFYLKNYNNAELESKVWRLLLDEVNIPKIKKEFKLTGEILSIIAIKNKRNSEILEILKVVDSEQSRGLIFTLLIVINHLTKIPDNKEIIRGFTLESLKFFDIIDIDIKIILVKNLITLFYNYPDLIIENLDLFLSRLFDQLKTYKEFEKSIQMGPYKYVIDQGLEIRKLVFELLYSIISNDSMPTDYNMLTHVIIEKSLNDKEYDIINLSYTSLQQLLERNAEFLNDFNNLELLTSKFSVNLNKKLKAKATTQEIETHQESIKNLINLLTIIDSLLHKYNWSYNNWDNYYTLVKRVGSV